MSCNETAIDVKRVSKCYQVYATPGARLKQFIIPPVQKLINAGDIRNYYNEFWSVKDVSFTIKRGETVGIIGNNGAGKSTLLQMICGILNPTEGQISVNGRIAALLELGSGFNMDFTGKENIYLNSALLGLSKKEIDEKFNEIVDFADIGTFINQQVKSYSSGMVARLAFAIAVQVNPDILVVDEALSVGDIAFQEKSFTKMKEIRDLGTSILFVSHSLSAVRNFCDTAIWMEKGQLQMIGNRLEVCDAYQEKIKNKNAKSKSSTELNADVLSLQESKKIIIDGLHCSSDKYNMGDNIDIFLNLKFNTESPKYGVGIIIYDIKGTIISILNTLRDDIVFYEYKSTIHLTIIDNHFGPGEYFITALISDELGMFPYDKVDYAASFKIKMERNVAGLARVDGVVRCQHEWSGV